MHSADIIKRPLITEKSVGMGEVVVKTKVSPGVYEDKTIKKYTFEVDYNADKTQVKNAIEQLFEGAKVEKVNIMNIRPKKRRVGKYTGYTNRRRKAIVTLAQDSADLF
ncbi:MAG: 50S ribosomal protein L23 [Culicoidibacterales bacterium]